MQRCFLLQHKNKEKSVFAQAGTRMDSKTRYSPLTPPDDESDVGSSKGPWRSSASEHRLSKCLLGLSITLFLVSIAVLIADHSLYHGQQVQPLTWTEFRNAPEYGDFSPSGDAIWESLAPNGTGFLFEWDEKSQRKRVVGISMFHQLHCLRILRYRIQVRMPAAPHLGLCAVPRSYPC